MKIAVVSSRCLKTHSSRYVNEIAPRFIDAGHETHVFTGKYDELDPRIKVHRIPLLPGPFYFGELLFTLFATLALAFRRFDVTLSQPTRYFSPKVCYMQFVYESFARQLNRNRLDTKLSHFMEGFNIRTSKRIIVMSNAIKNDLISIYGVPSEKVNVIYSGVDLKQFTPENKGKYRNEIRKELGLKDNEKVLLFVGNPYGRKGLEYLIRALPFLKNEPKLIVMGRDLGWDKFEKYLAIAKEIGVENRIVHGGFRSDIYRYFAAADIFAFPTLYEPFGLVILEAMASGIPVVTSRSAGAAELIENGVNGLLLDDPSNPVEIAEKINVAMTGNSLGPAARKRAENFTWDSTAREMLKVFGVVD